MDQLAMEYPVLFICLFALVLKYLIVLSQNFDQNKNIKKLGLYKKVTELKFCRIGKCNFFLRTAKEHYDNFSNCFGNKENALSDFYCTIIRANYYFAQ